MARTKSYTAEQALESAMQLFWRQGYSATSIAQLLDVMHISRSSMYEEFGNKQELFKAALAHYEQSTADILQALTLADDPVTAVRGFFESAFFNPKTQDFRYSCLLINSIVEFKTIEPELYAIASDYFYAIEKAFIHCFRRCINNGSLDAEFDPETLANFFISIIKGLRVVSNEHTDEAYLRSIMETSLLIFRNGTIHKGVTA